MQKRNNKPSCLISSAGDRTAPVCSGEDEPLPAAHWFLTSTQTIEALSAQDWKASVLGKGRTVETPDQVRGNQEASRDQAARILLTGSWESTCFEGPS